MNDETQRAMKILFETITEEMPEVARDILEGTIEGIIEHTLANPDKIDKGRSFGEAIEHLKRGRRVTRDGWNGKRMWLVLVKAEHWNLDVAKYPELLGVTLRPFIAMSTVDGSLVPWLASQTDMLAEDWRVAPET